MFSFHSMNENYDDDDEEIETIFFYVLLYVNPNGKNIILFSSIIKNDMIVSILIQI